MAERLTRNNKVNYYFHDEASNIVYYKLQKLEDIMEKYGIESVEELNQMLEWLFTLSGQDADDMKFITRDRKLIHQQYCDIKTDRDTCERACELACDVLRDINYKIYNEDRIDFENTFYQQAKKEGDSI